MKILHWLTRQAQKSIDKDLEEIKLNFDHARQKKPFWFWLAAGWRVIVSDNQRFYVPPFYLRLFLAIEKEWLDPAFKWSESNILGTNLVHANTENNDATKSE